LLRKFSTILLRGLLFINKLIILHLFLIKDAMLDPSFTPKRRNSNLRVVRDDDDRTAQQSSVKFYLFLSILAIGSIILGSHDLLMGPRKDPIVIDKDGNVALSPDRKGKLDKELKEIDNAEQYALLASVDGYYPCYTCPDGLSTIYLHANEVWKYGTTRKGEQGRYPKKNFGASNVYFVVQFWGTFSDCLKIEKTKIYSYPLLPEARKRDVFLIRPPGNLNDN